MHAKMKRLEELVNGSVALIKKLEEENAVLKAQVEALAADRQKIIKSASGTKELNDFKSRVRKKLLRINSRIDKTITLQETLFGDDFDDN